MNPTFATSLWPAARSNWMLQVMLAVAGSIILAISAQVSIPVQPVPFTLQTLALLLIGAAYGPWLGAATLLLYLAEGAVGLPVFQGFKSAFQVYYSAGYLIAYPFAAFIAGFFTRDIQNFRQRGFVPGFLTALIAFLAADALVFALGYAWLANLIGGEKAWYGGVAPFLIWDGLKVAIAALITVGAWQTIGDKTV